MVTNPEVVVVLPALNERETVGRQVQAILAHPTLRTMGVRRIVVVDNGSIDDTSAVALAAGAEIVREPRRGYGAACLAGAVAAVGADVLLLMDADGSDDLAGAAQVARLVVSGEADLAMGSRLRGHAERGALTPAQRTGNLVATTLMRPIYGLHITDLGPTRAIRRDALLTLDMCEMTYGWSTEMLAKAARAGLRVAEIPVDYHARAAGRSKVSGTLTGSLRAGYRILATACRYARWRPDAHQQRSSADPAFPDAGVSEGVA